MARLFTAKVEGLESVIRRLKKLPERNRRHAMRPAVRAAATPVVKAAKRLAPRGSGLTPDGRERENLYKTIKKTGVKWYRDTDTFLVVVGPERNKAPHAHLVHDGTQPHDIVLKKSLFLGSAVIRQGTVIKHPGAKANPYLEKAVEATRSEVQNKLRDKIVEGIEKQVKKLRRSK